MLIFKKDIYSPAEFEPATWMQVSCTSPWAICAVVFNGMLLEFSPLLRLQPAAECKLLTTLTRGDKLEVEGWWICDVRQLMCWCRQSQESYRRHRQTDGQDFSFIYIDNYEKSLSNICVLHWSHCVLTANLHLYAVVKKDWGHKGFKGSTMM